MTATAYNPGTTIAGTSIVVRFTWSAVAALQAEHGKLEAFRYMGATLRDRGVEDIAKLIALASGLSVEKIMADCPPLNPAIDALQDAWLAFLYGPDKKAPEDRQDANPPQGQSTSFGARLMELFGLGSAGLNSGPSQPSKPN